MKKIKKFLSFFLITCILVLSLGVEGIAATVVYPIVTLNSIGNQLVNSTVTVSGRSSTPCYRMAAKYVHNGTTTWLGEVYSNTYSKSFKVTSAGTYVVTLYARSYPESDSRSGSSSKTITVTVYNGKTTPTVTITNVSHNTSSNTITVRASSTTPCYRMSANYVINGKRNGWAMFIVVLIQKHLPQQL